MIQSPFIPFIILFCHLVETPSATDLSYLRSAVETLEATADSDARTQTTCSRQRRLFRTLYDVAEKYVEVKSRAGAVGFSLNSEPVVLEGDEETPDMDGTTATAGAGEDVDVDVDQMLSYGQEYAVGLQGIGFADVDVEMDFSGAQLWDWFSENQSIMRMLEDT